LAAEAQFILQLHSTSPFHFNQILLPLYKSLFVSEARFFEIRKKSAMTVALSPKKTITY
jgi:hypothetical protein